MNCLVGMAVWLQMKVETGNLYRAAMLTASNTKFVSKEVFRLKILVTAAMCINFCSATIYVEISTLLLLK